MGEIPAGESAEVTLFTEGELVIPEDGREYLLSLYFYDTRELCWNDHSQYCAFWQEKLKEQEGFLLPVQPAEGKRELSVCEKGSKLLIQGEGFEIEFDRVRGFISGYQVGADKLIEKGYPLNLWRAPVDNDRNTERLWRDEMVYTVQNIVQRVEIEEKDGAVLICCHQVVHQSPRIGRLRTRPCIALRKMVWLPSS